VFARGAFSQSIRHANVIAARMQTNLYCCIAATLRRESRAFPRIIQPFDVRNASS
jgi:hypothetical protein